MTMRTNPKQKVHEISLAQIEDDAELQPRTHLNQEVIIEYSEAMLEGRIFEPICVFFDGFRYWLADGYHRFAAAKKAELASIRAYVYEGSKEDALLFSVSANAANGMRRSPADKRLAVSKMLDHPRWCHWTDTKIAGQCQVGVDLVRRIRERCPELAGHDIQWRVNGEGEVINTARRVHAPRGRNLFGDEEPVSTDEPKPQLPPSPLTKEALTDAYVRPVVKALQRVSRDRIMLDAKTPFGTAEIVQGNVAYLFVNVFERVQIFASIGRGLLLMGHLNMERLVIVGTFHPSMRQFLASAESMLSARNLNITFRSPQDVVKDAEG